MGFDLTVHNMSRLMNVLFPPNPEQLGVYLENGFKDGHR